MFAAATRVEVAPTQQREDEMALRARLARQQDSAARALRFVTRKLSGLSRRGLEFEEACDRLKCELVEAAKKQASLQATLTIAQSNLEMLQLLSQRLVVEYKTLHMKHVTVLVHRDSLLASNSWRVSAPLRKIKTTILVAWKEPNRLVPLLMANLAWGTRLRPPPPPTIPQIVSEPVVLFRPPEMPVPSEDQGFGMPPQSSLSLQAPVLGGPEYHAVDHNQRLAALIRHDVAMWRRAAAIDVEVEVDRP